MLRTLGRLALEGTDLTRPQPLLLLAYLGLEGPVSREHVAQLFWPNRDRGRKNLSMALSRLRGYVDDGLDDGRDMLVADVGSDVERFLESFRAGDMASATRWYGGPFLPDAPGDAGSAELEAWVLEHRERFARRACHARAALGRQALAAQDVGAAAEHAEHALHEIRRHGLTAPELLAELHGLLRAVGSPDAADTAALLAELGIGAGGDVADDGERHPLPRIPLVGREPDLERAESVLMAPDARLVTVTGPAGVGKTSLAAELAHRAAACAFADGVRWVPLASARSSAEVVGRMAGRLGVADARGALSAVVAALQGRDLLVVMDGFEHALDAAGALGRISAASPESRFLVTSRSRLQLRGEHEVPLDPLETREASGSAGASSAAELFLTRVRSVRPAYRPEAGDLARIEEICRRLDGLPLAIELAAAQAKAFDLQEIRDMLDDRFELLRGGFRDAPARQRSLVAAVDWSYRPLGDPEKRVFRHLAVFRGSFDLAAVAHVLGETRAAVAAPLRVLVDHHLVKPVGGRVNASRFRLLETLRAYAERRLVQAAERTEAERANAERLATLVEDAAEHLVGADRAVWSARLGAEADNLRGALAWCAAAGDRTLGSRIATGAWRYWISRGELREARAWLDTFVPEAPGSASRPASGSAPGGMAATEEPAHADLRFQSRRALATVLHELGAFAEARRQLEALLDGMDAADPRRAQVAVDLAWVLAHLGDLDRAEATARFARDSVDAATEPRTAALAENDLGWIGVFRGAWADAEARFRVSLDLRRRARDERGIAFAEINAAWAVVRERGAFSGSVAAASDLGEDRSIEDARMRCDAAERSLRDMGDAQLSAWAGTVGAELLTATGRSSEAWERGTTAIGAWRRVGNADGLALAHEALAGALLAGHRFEEAADAARASLEIRDDTQNPWGMARARIQLGMAALERGDPRGAGERFRRARGIASALGNEPFLAICRIGLRRAEA